MNYLIKIGHQQYFLKGDTGLATTMKTLGRMKEINKVYNFKTYTQIGSKLDEPEIEVSITTKTEKNFIFGKSEDVHASSPEYEEIEPEVMHPESDRQSPKQIGTGSKQISSNQQLRLLGEGS